MFSLSACKGFFEELPLESERTSDESSPSTSTRTFDEAEIEKKWNCDTALSGCIDQDTLVECSGEERQVVISNCDALCNNYVPVTCMTLSNNSHGCWCESAGPQRVQGCKELEGCVQSCGGPELAPDCVHKCFERSVAQTIRLYGALVHCADQECAELCRNNPAQCAYCRQKTQQGLIGTCASLRASCDQDAGEDQAWGQ